MTDFTTYDSFEEMMEDLGKSMKAADSRVKPTQASVKPEQYFINFRHGPDLPIFGKILDSDDDSYKDPHMRNYRLTKAYSAACSMGETGDIHVSEIDAIIDKELFEYYREKNWRPPSREEKSQERIFNLLDELKPLSQHSDLYIMPSYYDSSLDTLHMEVIPRSPIKWAETAYQFANHENMKYDRDSHIHGIDGQPRVTYSGHVWVRFASPFIDGSKVAFYIWAQQPSHDEAEEQLMKFYGLFKERNQLEPMDLFRKYL